MGHKIEKACAKYSSSRDTYTKFATTETINVTSNKLKQKHNRDKHAVNDRQFIK